MTENHNELPVEGTEEQFSEQTSELTSTIGTILRQARIEASMTLEDIASRLHLKEALVEEIEQDKFDHFASPTYARGHIRSFARIVNADESLVLECLEQQLPIEAAPAMQSFSRKTTQKARDSRLMLITWLLAVLLLALLVIWWMQKSSSSDAVDLSRPSVEEVAAAEELGGEAAGIPVLDTASEQVQSSVGGNMAPAQDRVLAETPASEAKSSETQALENKAVEVDGTTEVYSATNSDETSDAHIEKTNQSVPVKAENDNDVSLSFQLKGDSWIKVEDATGKLLVHGVKPAGKNILITGVPPFNLVLGAPQFVSLSYNGNNVSLTGYPSNKVARFTLPRG